MITKYYVYSYALDIFVEVSQSAFIALYGCYEPIIVRSSSSFKNALVQTTKYYNGSCLVGKTVCSLEKD